MSSENNNGIADNSLVNSSSDNPRTWKVKARSGEDVERVLESKSLTMNEASG